MNVQTIAHTIVSTNVSAIDRPYERLHVCTSTRLHACTWLCTKLCAKLCTKLCMKLYQGSTKALHEALPPSSSRGTPGQGRIILRKNPTIAPIRCCNSFK